MFSPFQQHLGTNYAPSIEEVEEIKRILEFSELSKEIHDIDIEITQLHKRLHLLQERRSRVGDFLDQHRALVSPARRISQDVLEEIFLACLPADRNPCITATEAPLLLTHICRSWRSIAQSLPQLWSAIHIVIPTLRPRIFVPESIGYESRKNSLQHKLQQLQVAVDQWLERSRACPLSISIIQTPVNGTMSTNEVDVIAEEEELQLHVSFLTDILVPYCQRWNHIDIFLPPQSLNGLFEDKLQDQQMSALKSFHITSRNVHHIFPPLQSVDTESKHIFKYLTPQLTSVTLLGIIFQASDLFTISSSVWEHLTELNFNLRPPSGSSVASDQLEFIAHDMIRHCRSLETFKLSVFDYGNINTPRDSWPNHIGFILLPNLTMLSLNLGNLSPKMVGFVKHLCVPSLKKLDIQFSRIYNNGTMCLECMDSLLLSAGHTLESLTLYSPGSLNHVRSIVKYLQMTPSLKCIKLSSSDLFYVQDRWAHPAQSVNYTCYQNVESLVGDDLLRALSPLGKEYSDILCPQLEVIDSDPAVITGISSSALKELVKSRRHSCHLDDRIADLQQVRIFVNEHRNEEDSKEERIVLGKNSAVYFRKQENDTFSYTPEEGFVVREEYPLMQTDISYEVYTDL